MSGRDKYCVLRIVKRSDGGEFAPWPIGLEHCRSAAELAGYLKLDRPSIPCSPMEWLPLEPVLCTTHQEAGEIMRDADQVFVPGVARHVVGRILDVRCDVWLHDHYDGSAHVMARDVGFYEARLLFLAAVGWCAHQRNYWAPNWAVSGGLHREEWRPRELSLGIELPRRNLIAKPTPTITGSTLSVLPEDGP